MLALLANYGPVQRTLFALRRLRKFREPISRTHPFDTEYGVRTSGFMPARLLRSGHSADAHSTAYAGCQPSCVRRALHSIPGLQGAHFVDLGCGMGRALIIASEFPFAACQGVELSPGLTRSGQRNTQIVAARDPTRPPMTVEQGDASTAPLPVGRLVVFLYHSFDAALVETVARRVMEHAKSAGPAFFVYENPVHGAVLDGLPGFARWFADHVALDEIEQGFSFEGGDTVVVWRTGGDAHQASPSAHRSIVLTLPGWRAEIR